ncbi:hypothetical protein GOODEAATRI_014448 [Goodea atripinnis]|uniref:Uncharacterized protein n=1 Tax=Goodea atripinnis TaxID=208336 RepID=A0ABV0PEB0_9TELE
MVKAHIYQAGQKCSLTILRGADGASSRPTETFANYEGITSRSHYEEQGHFICFHISEKIGTLLTQAFVISPLHHFILLQFLFQFQFKQGVSARSHFCARYWGISYPAASQHSCELVWRVFTNYKM